MIFLVAVIISLTAVSAADTSNSSVSTTDLGTHVQDVSSQATIGTTTTSDTSSQVTSEKSSIKSTTNDNISNEADLRENTKDNQVINKTSSNIQTNTLSNNKTTTKNLKSSTSKSKITIKMGSYVAHPYQTITLNATVRLTNGKPLNNVTAVYKLNSVTIGHTNITNGVASLKYTIPKYSAKTYPLMIKVGETDTSLAGNATSNLKIEKSNIKVSMDSYTVVPKDKVTITAKAVDVYGHAVDGNKVTFKVNGVTIGSTNVSKGVAKISYIAPSKIQTYTIQVIVGGSSFTNSGNATSKLTVKKSSSKITLDNIYFVKYRNLTINVKVTSSNGTLANSGNVTFKIDGKTIKTVSVSNGVAKFAYGGRLALGTRNLSVIYGGSSSLYSSNATSKLRVQDNLTKFTYEQILRKANDTKDFIEKYGRLPNFVNIDGTSVTTTDFLYLLCNVYGTNDSYYAGNFKYNNLSKTSNGANGTQITKSDYSRLARSIVKCYIINGRSPNSITVNGTSMNFDDAVYFYTRAVAYIYNYGEYSNYGTVIKVNSISTNNFNSNDSDNNSTVNKSSSKITLDNIYFVKYRNLTINVKVTSSNGTLADSGKVTFKIDGTTIKTVSVNDGVATFAYGGKLGLRTHDLSVIYEGSSSLYGSNATSKLRVQDNLTGFTYEQILRKANDTKDFIEKYGRLPNFVNIDGTSVTTTDFLYLLCNVYGTNDSYYAGNFKYNNLSKTSNGANGTQITKSDYSRLARSIVKCYIINGRSPNSITVNGTSMSFDDAFYFYTRAVAYLYNYGEYSNYGTVINVNSLDTDNSSSNTNVVPAGYSKYLQITTNCEVNSSVIKKAVAAATKGVSGTYNQAVAIFDYVNDNTHYSGYYNTRYGAVGTLTRGYGNCVDMSHLLIAMLRTANIPAIYCHATCTFRSGLVVGHVWVKAYVNNKWVYCDATSSSNTFGHIVNWNSCGTIHEYIQLPF